MSTTPTVTLPRTELLTIRSGFVHQDFTLSVALPISYQDSDKSYPVLYVLDANLGFATARDIVNTMVVTEDMPELIVVGVGYPVERETDILATRTRDLTPTPVDGWYDMVSQMFSDAPPYVGSGGAADFLDFLKSEAMPVIERRYRVLPTENGLFGTSLGGLFALYALLEVPGLFRRCVITSPAFYWDDNYIVHRTEEYAARLRGTTLRVFMSAGESLLKPAVEQVAVLLAAAGADIEVDTFLFDCDVHIEAAVTGVPRGLRLAYADLCRGSEAVMAEYSGQIAAMMENARSVSS